MDNKKLAEALRLFVMANKYPTPARLLEAADRIEALADQLAEKDEQLLAAVSDLEKHCSGCTHQTNGEFGCDCEGPCDPTKWRGPQEAAEPAASAPKWAAQFERRFICSEEATHGKD